MEVSPVRLPAFVILFATSKLLLAPLGLLAL